MVVSLPEKDRRIRNRDGFSTSELYFHYGEVLSAILFELLSFMEISGSGKISAIRDGNHKSNYFSRGNT